MIQTIRNAWKIPELRKKLVRKIMKTDFSWSASAEQYLQMYNELS